MSWPAPVLSRPAAWPGRGRTSISRPPGGTATCRWPGTWAARFGQEVVDRLVDPLLGGVYAGRSEELSFEATLARAGQRVAPARVAGRGRESAAAGPAAPGRLPPPRRPAPVFTTLAAGLGTLPAAVAAASGLRTHRRDGARARPHGGRLAADRRLQARRGVPGRGRRVLAVPASPAARLLAGVPGTATAAAGLREIRYASMAVVTLAYPAAAFPQPAGGQRLPGARRGRPPGQGGDVLLGQVAAPARRHRSGLRTVLAGPGGRGSAAANRRRGPGRAGRARPGRSHRRPRCACRHPGEPLGRRTAPVHRRPPGPRRRDPGRRGRQPGLAVCGAAYDGIGIPACVATARLAAGQIVAYLGERGLAGAGVPMADNGRASRGAMAGTDGGTNGRD